MISPQLAAEWLQKNISNRPLRRQVVSDYARQMKSNSWVTTHQGICRDSLGNLIDGQHRLQAVVEADVSITMSVTTLDREGTALGLPVDVGLKRTYSDVLQIPKWEVELIRLMFRIAVSNWERRITFPECTMVHDGIKNEIRRMPPAIIRASCPHRLGTFLAMMADQSRSIEILQQSAWFVVGSDCSQWWPSVEAMNVTVKKDKRPLHDDASRLNYVIRWRAAMLQVNKKSTRVHDEQAAIKEVRNQCRDILKDSGVLF